MLVSLFFHSFIQMLLPHLRYTIRTLDIRASKISNYEVNRPSQNAIQSNKCQDMLYFIFENTGSDITVGLVFDFTAFNVNQTNAFKRYSEKFNST